MTAAAASIESHFWAGCPDGGTLRRLLVWYLSSRLVVGMAVLGGWALRPDLSGVALLRRLDAAWYLDVARFGYVARAATPAAVASDPAVLRAAFFPLWPFLARITTPPGVSMEVGATVLAAVLGFGVVVGSWVLVRRLTDAAAADRAALLTCLFPGSYVLSTAYAEALMLCLAIGCLLALLEQRWVAAGVAAALATATRPNAVALVPACLWAAAVAIARHQDRRSLVAPVLAPLGAAAFHLGLWVHTRRPDAWLLTQRNGWGERTDFGIRTLERLGRLVSWSQPDTGTVLLAMGLSGAVAGAWALWRWHPPAVLVLYAAGVIGLALVTQTLGPRPRFVYTALPLVWALAVWLREESFRVLAIASCGGLATLSVLYIVGSVAKP